MPRSRERKGQLVCKVSIGKWEVGFRLKCIIVIFPFPFSCNVFCYSSNEPIITEQHYLKCSIIAVFVAIKLFANSHQQEVLVIKQAVVMAKHILIKEGTL